MAEPEERDAGEGARRTPTPTDDEISLWEVLAFLVRNRMLIVMAALLVGAFMVGRGLLATRTWTSHASFRPQGASNVNGGQISSLAAQFGVNVGGATDEDSPAFYAELLQSRTLLMAVVDQPVPDPDNPGAIPLHQLLEMEMDDAARRDEVLIRWLSRNAMSVDTDRETGMVTVAVSTEWPAVSHVLSERLVAEVNRFNAAARRSRASAERAFVQEQLDSAQADLREAERRLEGFLEANRQFQNSPELRFEHDRLQRDVLMRQQLFTSLSEAFQQARISEVRNTPVITVVQEAYLPPLPDRRGLVGKLAFGLLLGTGLGIGLGLIRTAAAPDRAPDRRAYNEVKEVVEALRRRQWRRVLFG
ncbi:MAG: Wzz/FepE/Etk N-terminal domain-containing protein [Longimicrobiales bacterium]